MDEEAKAQQNELGFLESLLVCGSHHLFTSLSFWLQSPHTLRIAKLNKQFIHTLG